MNKKLVMSVVAKEYLLGEIKDPAEAKVFMLFYIMNRLGVESVYEGFNGANIQSFIKRLAKV